MDLPLEMDSGAVADEAVGEQMDLGLEPDAEVTSAAATEASSATQMELELESEDTDADLAELRASVVTETVDSAELEEALGQASIWGAGAVGQGRDFETLEKANIAGNYPVIDNFEPEDGFATSMKTMDLAGRSYAEDPAAVRNTLLDYIDDLSDFEGRTWHQDDVTIKVAPEDIEWRELDLAIPAGKATAEQLAVLAECRNYAADKGVALTIKEVP
ncbi:MAG: hypothetical protein GXY76_22750 [Chloroflexi bacterium]|nr:hypothetical protein [Chloroflexota bacterium]